MSALVHLAEDPCTMGPSLRCCPQNTSSEVLRIGPCRLLLGKWFVDSFEHSQPCYLSQCENLDVKGVLLFKLTLVMDRIGEVL